AGSPREPGGPGHPPPGNPPRERMEKRLIPPLVGFADENAHENLLTVEDSHVPPPVMLSFPRASAPRGDRERPRRGTMRLSRRCWRTQSSNCPRACRQAGAPEDDCPAGEDVSRPGAGRPS